jgi:hypothetical protein
MKIKALFTSLLLIAGSAFAGSTGKVSLAWDATTDPTITEVKIYYGTASGVYGTTPIVLPIVPPATSVPTTVTVTGLVNSTTYFFAATYVGAEPDGTFLESLFSNEVNTKVPYAPPAAPTNLKEVSAVAK